MPHDPYKRRVKVLPSVIPTDIIEMHCLGCGKVYRRNGLGLRIDNSTGEFLPCTNGSMSITKIESLGSGAKCECTDYRVYRQMELVAMPIGRVHTDLRPES